MRARRTTLLAVAVILSMAFASMAMAQDLIVVANDDTYKAAQKWVDFLLSKMISLKHVAPGEFANYKTEQYIVLMGSIDEPGGIAGLLKEALSDSEFEAISKDKGMYIKSDVWGEDQGVIVFAGANKAAAEAARTGNKEEWWNELVIWFDIEEGGAALHGY
jgi:hypothetical protein